jgi:hypothetical protein
MTRATTQSPLLSRTAIKKRIAVAGALLPCFLLVPGSARASDGRLEINQACVATGCFPGDAPGFPVQTAAGQSYVLTSSLAVPDANTTAIQLGDNSALDLGGFRIEGVTSCSASPTLCTNTGTGIGVAASSGSVRNGRIRQMGSHGIRGSGLVVENVIVDGNGGDGISGAGGPVGWMVRSCRIQLNGGDGIDLNVGGGSDGALVERNVIRRNGATGVIGVELLIRDNAIVGNDSYGIGSNAGGGTVAAYGGNYLTDNFGANPEVSGGVQLGPNSCNGNPTCP